MKKHEAEKKEAVRTEDSRPKLDTTKLRREGRQKDVLDELEQKPPAVSAGAIDRVVDLAFNPSRDKIREVTVIDRVQGRLLPQLDIIDLMWQHIIEVAAYRQDAVEFVKAYKKSRPVPPNLIEEFTYRTAQWQKSIGGQNLKSAVDLALAETETRGEEESPVGADGFRD